uniref:uncharacterized protein LOC120335856 isoform X1 n=1 Tax=Styela clava TaxID=7725 RepID=UPI001939ADFF|nr:uncharacterized protein LOC120335856 isoform X1 [Styela clava]
MNTSVNAEQRLPNQHIEPPSIEITPDNDEILENVEEPVSTDRQRRRRSKWLSPVLTSRGVSVSFVHLAMGVVIIAIACVVKTFVVLKPKAQYLPSVFRAEDKLFQVLESVPQVTFPSVKDNQMIWKGRGPLQSPSAFVNYPASLEDSCHVLTCHPYLPLICISIGCVFLICGFSGGFMMLHRMKEYVCCHLVWVSLSVLCSITLSAGCIMGMKTVYSLNINLFICVCALLTATILEIIFCIMDLYVVSSKFYSSNSRFSRWHQRATSGHGDNSTLIESGRGHRESNRRQSRRGETIPSGTQRNGQQTRTAETTFISQGTDQRTATTGNISTRTNLPTRNNSRTRRSGQATRDRNFLYPGYHQQSRNRMRRRPMLRAQNHYVLIPTAYGRSRVTSRVGRTHTLERRNRIEMPTFVIANHDRYVQALNRSMETLEMEPNRGSVPSDVLPSTHVDIQDGTTKAKESLQEGCDISKQSDTSSISMSLSSLQSGGHRLGPESNVNNSNEPMYAIDDQSSADKTTNKMIVASCRPKQTERSLSGYSVVRRSKEGIKRKSERQLETQSSSELFEPKSYTNSHPHHSSIMAHKLSHVASTMDDAVFHDSTAPDWCANDSGLTGQESSTSKQTCGLGNDVGIGVSTSQTRLYNTSSDGDFSTISTESSATPVFDRACYTSVSSDSGINEAAKSLRSKRQKRHYYNVPLTFDPRMSLELKDISSHGAQSSLSPVSPATPSYENVQSARMTDRDAFIFNTYASRSNSEDRDDD